MSKPLTKILLLLLLHLLVPVTARPQAEESSLLTDGGQKQAQEEKEPKPKGVHDPLRWVWLDGSSLSLEWPSRFSLSINGAVTAYSLSLTHPHHSHAFLTTTMFHAPTLRHQFEGLRSNVTYDGRLMALVGPHHWPYTLLNFTVTSPTLHTGLGLGQRAHPGRPRSTTADLDAITVSVTLRWSPTPFLKGNTEGETVRPIGYRLRVWDQKKLVTRIATEASTHTQDCEAAVGGLTLDSVYKATLDAVMTDGAPGTSLTFILDAGALHVAGGGLTTDGVSECYSGLQVRCPGSERCVSPYWICDGAPDCPDGVDEDGCDTTPCDGFQCWEDVCIPWAWRCDGRLDCKGGDDEYACPSCDQEDLRCPWGGACLQSNATCDGVAHCMDGWDESAALCGSVTCGAGELQCLGGNRCVPHQWLCDGVSDCPAAEDEDATFCSAFNSFRNNNVVLNTTNEDPPACEGRETPRRVNCTEKEFRCDSRSCVLLEYLCDGVRDCENGRDELPRSCSLAPTQASMTPKFKFDSEEGFGDADQPVFSREDEEQCNEQESGLCDGLDTHTGRGQHSTTTENSQTHSQEPSRTEKTDPILDYDNSIEEDLPDWRTSTTTTTTSQAPFVSIIEADMTDVGGNEIDVHLIQYSDAKSSDAGAQTTNKTRNVTSVNLQVTIDEEELKPSLAQPETGLNFSSSEENDYEEIFTLDIEGLSPLNSKNVTDPTRHSKEISGQDTNKTSFQNSDLSTDVTGEVLSSEETNSNEENENVTLPLFPQNEDSLATDDPEEARSTEDDSVILVVSKDPLTVQVVSTSEGTTGTEATIVKVTPLLPGDDSTHTTTTTTTTTTTVRGITQGSPTSRTPGVAVTSAVPPTSLDLTPSPEVKKVAENASLSSTVTSESVVTEDEDSIPGDITSVRPTFTTSRPTVTISKKPEAAIPTAIPVPTSRTEESTTAPEEISPTPTTPSSLPPSLASTTQPPTEETAHNNITILIAIRAGLNETEIPQYTIHGADGNTYQYEIVSIVKEDETAEKDMEELRNAIEEEEELTNEIRGDGSHQFLQGINISSATKFSSLGTWLLVPVLFCLLFTTAGLDVK